MPKQRLNPGTCNSEAGSLVTEIWLLSQIHVMEIPYLITIIFVPVSLKRINQASSKCEWFLDTSYHSKSVMHYLKNCWLSYHWL